MIKNACEPSLTNLNCGSLEAQRLHYIRDCSASATFSRLNEKSTVPSIGKTAVMVLIAKITILVANFTAALAVSTQTAQSASITPHDMYSSSIGALGCKLETNRVAYWPGPVDCDNICVKVSHKGRSVNLLKIDTSGGSYDISYDAWNYLAFGQSARDEPHQGGGITMDYEFVNADECKPLLQEGKLELTAANSINFVASCLQNGSSWIARNYKLVNLLDPVCKYGYDEECHLDLGVSNQPSCAHQLGSNHSPTGLQVINIEYGSGKEVAIG